MKAISHISLAQARQLAEDEAFSLASGFIDIEQKKNILAGQYLEERGCWMFFRNKELEYPSDASLAASAAYVVSKDGRVRTVADMSENPIQMASFIKRLSDYFQQEN